MPARPDATRGTWSRGSTLWKNRQTISECRSPTPACSTCFAIISASCATTCGSTPRSRPNEESRSPKALSQITGDTMGQTEIEVARALLSSKSGPAGWPQRRQRLDEVGSVWPVADDVKLAPVDLGGVGGEWSVVPGSDATRVLLFFHGGGYCSGSTLSHRPMVTEA